MQYEFSKRVQNVPPSFIREILKVTNQKDIISFAGGLPNPRLFPIDELKESAQKTFKNYGSACLQYNITEGIPELREYICEYYKKRKDITIHPKNIIITNGSQQGLDLIGKVFLNENDDVFMEAPGYLGAIQAFTMFSPKFHQIELTQEGMDVNILSEKLRDISPKLMYVVPNFQNPSGISYSTERRKEISELFKKKNTIIVEDDPYGELNYSGRENISFKKFLPDQTLLLGTFSKTAVPGFRIGWIVAPDEVMKKIIIAKQAADLHTNSFTQMLLFQYISNFNIDEHIQKIRKFYGSRKDAMVDAAEKYFPKSVKYTNPEGGMFMWATLPEGASATKLFELSAKENVVFVPGHPFYVDKKETNSLRLNFTHSTEDVIDEGMKRLGNTMKRLNY